MGEEKITWEDELEDILIVDSHLDVPLDYLGSVFVRNDHGESVLYIDGNLSRSEEVIINRVRMKEEKMEKVLYKGHTIQVKYYPAFTHGRRSWPEIFDYVILDEKERICKGYSLKSAEEAITEAKRFIDQGEKLLVREAAICAEEMED